MIGKIGLVSFHKLRLPWRTFIFLNWDNLYWKRTNIIFRFVVETGLDHSKVIECIYVISIRYFFPSNRYCFVSFMAKVPHPNKINICIEVAHVMQCDPSVCSHCEKKNLLRNTTSINGVYRFLQSTKVNVGRVESMCFVFMLII